MHKRVCLDEVKIICAAVGAHYLVVTSYKLVNVAIDAALAKAFAALSALFGLDHDILAQTAIKEGVMRRFITVRIDSSLANPVDLVLSQCCLAQKYHWACTFLIFFVPGHKLGPVLILSHADFVTLVFAEIF